MWVGGVIQTGSCPYWIVITTDDKVKVVFEDSAHYQLNAENKIEEPCLNSFYIYLYDRYSKMRMYRNILEITAIFHEMECRLYKKQNMKDGSKL